MIWELGGSPLKRGKKKPTSHSLGLVLEVKEAGPWSQAYTVSSYGMFVKASPQWLPRQQVEWGSV